MMISFILVAVSSISVGVLIGFLGKRKFDSNPLKDPVNSLNADEIDLRALVSNKDVLDLYLKEWNVIIETQMHFNDLILRFRSFILTAFFVLLSAIIGMQKIRPLKENEYFLLLLIPCIFWISAFIVDFFYYHKMLIGAVAQAKKFDENDFFIKQGFFGLTKCISNHIAPSVSRLLVVAYYFLPLLFLGIIYIVRRFYLQAA